MAVGEKYAALTHWLQKCEEDSVCLSFDQLNTIIALPKYAYTERTAWANLRKPASFCSSWLNAGYRVDSIRIQEQRVVFRKMAEEKEIHHQVVVPIRKTDPEAITRAIRYGYSCYDGIAADPNHRYLSWEYCHEAFRQSRNKLDERTIDYLCLHLAWYLASWGMLRNSFLMQKDYKIHADVVRLLYQPEWTELWDITPEKLAQEWYAGKILKLSETISETYVANGAGLPTETLLTKILLGTVGCTPAYDRYFKKGLSITNAAQQRCNVQSLTALGKLYIDRRGAFEELRIHCSERIEYPPVKIMDMCFFAYGYEQEGRPGEPD